MPLEYVDDLTPAKWIADRLHPFAQDAGAIIPPGFDAYARIFHPAARRDGQDRLPRTGTLPLHIARALVGVLGNHTRTPERCWFAAWEGWGDPVFATSGAGNDAAAPPAITVVPRPNRPTFKVPGRGYYIARGPLSAALETVYGATFHYQSASLWWPDDQAWCVATEVDFDWTYVGGSKDCMAAVLGDPNLEALPARLGDGVS